VSCAAKNFSSKQGENKKKNQGGYTLHVGKRYEKGAGKDSGKTRVCQGGGTLPRWGMRGPDVEKETKTEAKEGTVFEDLWLGR